MNVRNIERYLTAVVDQYREDCSQGFSDEWEAKQALWKVSVVIWEVSDEPESWLDQIREIALPHIKAVRIEGTIRSAERHAGSRYGR